VIPTVKFDKHLPTVGSGGRMVTARRRILLVDDDLLVRATFCEMLVSHGHEVVEAGDGAAGLAAFQEQGPFHAVLSDFQMPKLTGLEMVTAILKINPTQTICMASGDHSKEVLVPAGVAFLKKGYIAWERVAAALKLEVE
jgi:CheY-like chemotaxis protein